MGLDLRPIGPDELRPWMEAIFAGFGEDLPEESLERFGRILEFERTLAAFDGPTIVGGTGVFSFRLTVPGGAQLGAGGVTAVAVMPTHRRRGILRQMMIRQLRDVRAAGEPLAILWASEGNIYQRFGYGLASLNATIDVERTRANFRRPAEWSGTFRLVDAATAAQTFPAVYDQVAARTPGFYQRTPVWWEAQSLADPESRRRGSSRKFYLLHERNGVPTGYAMYRIKDEWDDVGSKNALRASEWMAVDPPAMHDIWRYLFGVDLIARISAGMGPVDHPLLLMVEEPRRLAMRVGDGLWLRIVDVVAALAGRTYSADGELVLEVTDELMPDCAGRWLMVVHNGRAEVSRTDRPAELRLDTTDLAAIYLGGFTLAALAHAGRGEELDAGARARADAMFATSISPWCPEIF